MSTISREASPVKAGQPAARRTTRPPVCRRASYHRVSAVYGTLLLTIVRGEGESRKVEEFGYHVEPVRSDFGRAFNLRKYETQQTPDEPTEYDVLIDVNSADPERPAHSCECLGWLKWGRCKHVAALLSLITAGKLD